MNKSRLIDAIASSADFSQNCCGRALDSAIGAIGVLYKVVTPCLWWVYGTFLSQASRLAEVESLQTGAN